MIKKQFVAALLLLSMQSFAQLNKGRIVINGNANYFKSNTDGALFDNIQNYKGANSITNTNLNVGYFVSNNFAVGIKGSFSTTRGSYATVYNTGSRNSQKNKSLFFSSGVFVRYNHVLGSSKFALFLQLDNSYNWGNGRSETIDTPINFPEYVSVNMNKSKGYSANLAPGVMYFINDKLSVEASLGSLYFSSTVTTDHPSETITNKSTGVSANFSASTFYLGLSFYLGKHKGEKRAENETNTTE